MNTFQRIVVKHLMYDIGKATCLFKFRIVHKLSTQAWDLEREKINFKIKLWLDFVVKQIMWSDSIENIDMYPSIFKSSPVLHAIPQIQHFESRQQPKYIRK
jgi:hypothetical protein